MEETSTSAIPLLQNPTVNIPKLAAGTSTSLRLMRPRAVVSTRQIVTVYRRGKPHAVYFGNSQICQGQAGVLTARPWPPTTGSNNQSGRALRYSLPYHPYGYETKRARLWGTALHGRSIADAQPVHHR